MKKVTIIIILVLVNALAFATNRNITADKVSIVSESASGVYNVSYKSEEGGKVKVSILSNDRKVIFTETLTHNFFVRPYNFNALGEGDYIILLEDKNGKVEEKVSFRTNKVSSLVSVSQLENNKYIFRAVSTGADVIRVKISSRSNEILHEESISVNGVSALVYNITNIETAPIFEMTSSNGTVTTVVF